MNPSNRTVWVHPGVRKGFLGGIVNIGNIMVVLMMRHIINEREKDWFEIGMYLGHGCANYDTEGKRFKSPIHCCDVMKPPSLISGELCTSPLHCLRTPCASAHRAVLLCAQNTKIR